MLTRPLQTTCTDGETSYGRKKRNVAKRQTPEDSGIDNISVGSALSITTEEVIVEGANILKILCQIFSTCIHTEHSFGYKTSGKSNQ
ncbi:hypothetical protein DPMN_187474 [Dreissena polymorpha]|uniref:Uncharacterized protein n=1 Tax=Dreissena polymorpha TaxID=45954 RepID=A0A9D4DPJ3_DREPO|nr:hypothetical protein DPMN_187474 [Dreissena polymorpha]